MKQLNVRDETHHLCKMLSVKTNKSVIVIIQEALELYREGCRELSDTESLIGRLLKEVGHTIEEAVASAAAIEIPIIVKQAIEKIYKERKALDDQLAKLAAEAADEEGDDLTVVDHDEFYSTETDDQEA